MQPVRWLLCLALLWAGLIAPAFAAEDTPRELLGSVKSSLAEIDDELKLANLSDGQLAQIRARVEPLGGQLQSVIAELTPRLDASRKRLAELKPKQTEGASTGAGGDEVKDEQAKFDKLDADLRSARAALLQVDDYANRIAAERRDIFARETFARTASVVSPVLWLSVARELPGDITAFAGLVARAGAALATHASWGQLGGFAAVVGLLAILAAPLRWMTRRVLAPHAREAAPGRLAKALVALWTLAVLAAVPLAALGALAYALDVFDITDPQLQGVVNAVFDGLRIVALGHACAKALLAPKLESWRLLPVGDPAARRLTRLVLAVTIVAAVAGLVEAIAETVFSYNLLVLARALAALAIVGVTANAFRRITRDVDAAGTAKTGGRPARTFAWAYLAAILVCALTGYIAFATFLIDHALRVGAALTTLYLADALLQESGERLLRSDAPYARSAMALLGLRREGLEQIVVVAQGLVRLAVIATGLLVAVGPFGMPSQDLFATLRTAYFGVSVGGVTLSISSLVAAIVVFFLVLAATRAAQTWLGERYLPRTQLDAGVKNSVRTIFGYVGWIAALLVGGSRLGVDPERLTWIAGGLSVGIGFGLQGIANNFISGLVLLWERGIRVGDWVVVGPDQGFVRRINARSTEIETFERATLIVPNNTLVTGNVKNWMHTDRVARILIPVHAAYESDPEAVRGLLIDAAKAQDAVLSIPSPLALLAEFGDWSMKFQLIVYVEDALMAERVRSEINFDVMRRMREARLRIPYPFPVGNVEAERGPNTSRTP